LSDEAYFGLANVTLNEKKSASSWENPQIFLQMVFDWIRLRIDFVMIWILVCSSPPMVTAGGMENGIFQPKVTANGNYTLHQSCMFFCLSSHCIEILVGTEAYSQLDMISRRTCLKMAAVLVTLDVAKISYTDMAMTFDSPDATVVANLPLEKNVQSNEMWNCTTYVVATADFYYPHAYGENWMGMIRDVVPAIVWHSADLGAETFDHVFHVMKKTVQLIPTAAENKCVVELLHLKNQNHVIRMRCGYNHLLCRVLSEKQPVRRTLAIFRHLS